jgi:hypothetical protein
MTDNSFAKCILVIIEPLHNAQSDGSSLLSDQVSLFEWLWGQAKPRTCTPLDQSAHYA